jgi:hypothetical protein
LILVISICFVLIGGGIMLWVIWIRNGNRANRDLGAKSMSFIVSGLNSTIHNYAQNVTTVADLASGQYSRGAVTFFADVDNTGTATQNVATEEAVKYLAVMILQYPGIKSISCIRNRTNGWHC